MQCAACKAYEKILEGRLRMAIQGKIPESQGGFIKRYSEQYYSFTIRNLTEEYLTYEKELYLCFIDLEKAFDRVPREKI